MPKYNKERFSLLPQEHTVLVRQTSKWGQIFLLSMVGLGATAFCTAYFYRIDEILTATGRLVPNKGGVEVKSPLSGRLKKILVKNGEVVEKNQGLVSFDVSNAEYALETTEKELALEIKKVNDALEGNKIRRATLERNIELSLKILKRLEPLENKGAISELQILQQQNQLEAQRDELEQLDNQYNEIQNNNKIKIAQLIGRLNQTKHTLKNEIVKAPISGTIFEMEPDNNDYVVVNAESLMKIVPKGKLSAKVNVSNKDIGFVKVGQPVKIRIDAFPYTEYGEINGLISSIGADALPPTELIRQYHFPVNIDMKRSNLNTKEGVTITLQA